MPTDDGVTLEISDKVFAAIEKTRNFLHRRRYVYRATFNGPLADEVLKDLARFCRAHESTFHSESHVAARLDGRREVWLRIAQHLELSPDQLWDIYVGRNSEQGK